MSTITAILAAHRFRAAPASPFIALTGPDTAEAGTTISFTTSHQDGSGNTISPSPSLSSGDPSVLVLHDGSDAYLLRPGLVTVTSTASGLTATHDVNVTYGAGAISYVDLIPMTPVVTQGGTAQVLATARNAAGGILDPNSYPVSYTSSDEAVATVDADGTIHGQNPGTCTITASAGGMQATASLVCETAGVPFYSTSFDDVAPGAHPAAANGLNIFNGAVTSADIARTGTQSLKFIVKAGPNDFTNETDFWLGRDVKELWWEYYAYYPTGSEGIAGVGKYATAPASRNHKYIRLFGGRDKANNHGPYEAMNKVGMETRPYPYLYPNSGEDTYLYVDLKKYNPATGVVGLEGSAGASSVLAPYVTDAIRGRWVLHRFHFRLGSGASDAIMECWVDGVLGYQNLNVSTFDPEYPFWDRGYLFGWANGAALNASAIYMDDLQFYSSDPGWV